MGVQVLDRRLGVNDRTVSEEEKVSKRFIAERLRRYEAKDDLGDSSKFRWFNFLLSVRISFLEQIILKGSIDGL